MNNTNWIEYKIRVKDRLKLFAMEIIQLSGKMPVSTAGKVINYQITKSGTSAYANYRAALRSRSKAEFFSKLSIAVEEADETEMWMDLCISSNILTDASTRKLHTECLEIVKVLASMRKRLSR